MRTLAILLASTILLGCGTAQTTNGDKESISNGQELIAQDLDLNIWETQRSQEEGHLLLDVRTQEEIDKGHIPGAMHLDFYSDDFEAQLGALAKDVPVYVYCRSGGRSGKTMKMMNDLGFEAVYNLEGGYQAWSQN